MIIKNNQKLSIGRVLHEIIFFFGRTSEHNLNLESPILSANLNIQIILYLTTPRYIQFLRTQHYGGIPHARRDECMKINLDYTMAESGTCCSDHSKKGKELWILGCFFFLANYDYLKKRL